MKKLIIYIFLVCMLLFSVQSVCAANITVHPGESIQSAVNSASDGDNIIVYDNNKTPYTYKESISIDKKIYIKSSGNVTIEAKNTSSAVFTVNYHGAGSSISNFIMTKSSYCIMINNANSCTISNNIISGASLVGIQFYGNMYNSRVIGNKITGLNPSVGNGISFEYGTCTNNTLYGNNISNFLNGIIFNDNSENNTVANNFVVCTGYNGAGIYTTDNARSMIITGNTIIGAEDGIAVQKMGTNIPINFYIDGNTLKGNKNGFWIFLSNSTISNNTATQNLVSGLDITGKYNKILNNNASNNGNCGITLAKFTDADYNTVNWNILNYNLAGINSASNYLTISNNNISNNSNFGLIVTADHNKINSNTVQYNNESGMLIIGTFNTINANTLTNNIIGILIQKSADADYNTITNNILNHNNNGINSGSPYSNFINNTITNCNENGLVNTAAHTTIQGNTIQNNGGTGILSIGIYNNISRNSLSNNAMGICLQKSTDKDYNSVTNNSVTNNRNGINSASPYSELNYNTVNYNNENGIVNTANNVNIKGNTVLNNGGTGVLGLGSYLNILNNLITGNNLGIYLQTKSANDYNTVTNNTANYNVNGINSGSNGTNFYNNTLNYNNQTGLTVTGSNCYVIGNSMNFNKEAGLTVTGINNIVVMNRLEQNLYGASFSNYKAAIFMFNSVIGNTYQLYSPDTSGTLNATNNWWGSNTVPSRIYGLFNVNPWIVLKVVSSPNKVIIENTSNITADLTNNSNGENTTLLYPEVFVPDGLIVNFSCDGLGSLGTLIGTTFNGLATSIFTGNFNGTSNIVANVNNQSLSTVVTILAGTFVTVNSSNGYKGDLVNLTAAVKDKNNQPIVGRSIRFWVDGTLVGTGTTNTSGIATYLYTINQNIGSHALLAQFLGDSIYSASNGTNSLVVLTNIIPTNITVNPVTGYRGDKVNLTATLKDSVGNPLNGKIVTFYINETNVGTATTNTYGTATYQYTITQSSGSYTIMAQFTDDGTYGASNNINNLQVNPKPTVMTVNSVSGYKGGKVDLIAILKDQNGLGVPGKPIYFSINGMVVGSALTDGNGMGVLSINLTAPSGITFSSSVDDDAYIITAQFNEDDDYCSSKNTNNLIVKLIPLNLNLNSVKGYKGNTVNLVANLKDYNNNPIYNKTIHFYVDNVGVGTANTDLNGIASLIYTVTQNIGTYNVMAVFLKDDDYTEGSNTNVLQIIPKKTVILVKPVSTYNGDKTNLTATLTDETNNPLVDRVINFIINGSLVGTATTNINGIATLAYTVLKTCGTYTLTAQFIDNIEYASINNSNSLIVNLIPTKITVKPVSSYYGDKVNLTATLTNTYRNISVAARTVNFYLNGKFVGTGVTNKSGIAYYTYTTRLIGGIYSLKAELKQNTIYKGSYYTNSLTVKKILTKLTTAAVSGRKYSTVKLTTTLTNTHTNTRLSNKTVSFYVSGKYLGTATTNKYGTATFYYRIKLNKGKYSLTTKYQNNTIYYGSTNTNVLQVT